MLDDSIIKFLRDSQGYDITLPNAIEEPTVRTLADTDLRDTLAWDVQPHTVFSARIGMISDHEVESYWECMPVDNSRWLTVKSRDQVRRFEDILGEPTEKTVARGLTTRKWVFDDDYFVNRRYGAGGFHAYGLDCAYYQNDEDHEDEVCENQDVLGDWRFLQGEIRVPKFGTNWRFRDAVEYAGDGLRRVHASTLLFPEGSFFILANVEGFWVKHEQLIRAAFVPINANIRALQSKYEDVIDEGGDPSTTRYYRVRAEARARVIEACRNRPELVTWMWNNELFQPQKPVIKVPRVRGEVKLPLSQPAMFDRLEEQIFTDLRREINL